MNITYNNDTWQVLGQGAKRDGKTYCHLASLTTGRQQRNGWYPIQIGEWIEDAVLVLATEQVAA